MKIPNGLALCAIHHKAFDKGSIGLDEDMRIQVSSAVNGGGIVGRLFWDFDGKPITLPQGKECYPQEGVCGMAPAGGVQGMRVMRDGDKRVSMLPSRS